MQASVAQKITNFFATYTEHTLPAGEALVQAGEDPAGVFYLVDGRVRQYDISEHGNELVVNTFQPPAFFPMSWAINKAPNEYVFEAATKITYRQAPADEVVEFLNANPDVTLDLLSRVYRGTDGLLRRMAYVMGGSARIRVLLELLIACRRFGVLQPDGSYVLDMHESDLAQAAGLSRETVSRELQKLRSNHLVKANRHNITVADLRLLEEALGFEPGAL